MVARTLNDLLTDMRSRISALERRLQPSVGTVGALSERGHGNLVVNGAFRINQRAYVSGTVVVPGLEGYGHDRWRFAGRTNRVRNPRMGTALTDWTRTGGTGADSRVTTGGPDSTNIPTFWRFTTSGSSAAPVVMGTSAANIIPILGGVTYALSAYVQCSTAVTVYLDALVYDASGAQITDLSQTNVPLTANTWTQLTNTFTAAYNAAFLVIRVVTTTTIGTTQTLDVTGFQVVEVPRHRAVAAADYVYLDGAMSGNAWVGTAHASQSVTTAFSYTFTQTPNGCTITLPAAPSITTTVIYQIIEYANVDPGEYTLSWEGSALGRVYTSGDTPPAFQSSPMTVTLVGTGHVVVGFTTPAGVSATLGKVQLVKGSVAYPFELRPMQQEWDLCYYYFWMLKPTVAGQRLSTEGAQGSTTVGEVTLVCPVPMRVLPLLKSLALYWTDQVAVNFTVSMLNYYPTNIQDPPAGSQLQLQPTFGAGGASHQTGILSSQNNTTSFISLSAEF